MYIYFAIIAVISSLITAISFYLFCKRVKNNLYSYKTIFIIGIALFLLFESIVLDYVAFFAIPNNPSITSKELMILIAGSGFNYMLLTMPLILVFSVSMTISNISLIRHEGKRFVNLLGIIISIALVVSWLVIVIIDINFSGNDDTVFYYYEIGGLYSLLYAYFECMLFGTIICGILAVYKKITPDKDFIVILGCRIKDDGSLYPLIKGRADKAIEFYNYQLGISNKKACFIPSGGKGSDEIISESEAVANYLISKGIPKEQILIENKSKTTKENMLFSKEIMSNQMSSYKAVFSTTNYHVLRSGIIAHDSGIEIEGIGARTKWYFWPNAFIREFIGLLVNSAKKQILVLCCIICLFLVTFNIVF